MNTFARLVRWVIRPLCLAAVVALDEYHVQRTRQGNTRQLRGLLR